MQLDRFQPGFVYDVGTILGALLLAEQWAEPVDDSYTSTVTPMTNIRQFAESGGRPRSQWRRRAMRGDRALAADRLRRGSKKKPPRH